MKANMKKKFYRETYNEHKHCQGALCDDPTSHKKVWRCMQRTWATDV